MKFLLTKVPSIVSGDKLFLLLLLSFVGTIWCQGKYERTGPCVDCPGYCQGVSRAFESATHVTLVVFISVSSRISYFN